MIPIFFPELDSPPFEAPKVDLFLEMEKLAVGITRAQYQRLIEMADGMGAMTRGIPYRKFRPFNTRELMTSFILKNQTYRNKLFFVQLTREMQKFGGNLPIIA